MFLFQFDRIACIVLFSILFGKLRTYICTFGSCLFSLFCLHLLNSLNECIPCMYATHTHGLNSRIWYLLGIFIMFWSFSFYYHTIFTNCSYEIYLLRNGARWHSFTWHIVFSSYLISVPLSKHSVFLFHFD